MQTGLLRGVMLCVMLLVADVATATDLTISRLVLPGPSITAGTQTKITFDVANINILAASGYTIGVQVKNTTSGVNVFNEVVQGITIQPNTEVRHTTEQMWTASVGGSYEVTLAVVFLDDINLTNNVKKYNVTVIDQPILQLAAYALFWRTMYSSSFFGDAAFDLTLTQSSNRWRYANVLVALTRQVAATWVLRNILLPPLVAPYTFTTHGDLSGIIPNTSTSKPDSLMVSVVVSDTPMNLRAELPEYASLAIPYLTRELSISYGLRDSTKTAITTSTPVTPPTTTRLKDTVYRGCTVPNMDLDSATNNPSTVAGYAGDLNACAPTAAANSMQWLEDSNPKIRSGLTHRKKLEALSKAMKRENNTGVWVEDFIRGKLEYIAANNLPISVKFQVRGLTKDVINFPDSDYDAKATNKGTGGYPKFDFVKKEMADSEDVETFVEYHDPEGDSSTVVGRHVITCTGAASDSAGRDRTFWYKDDKDQRRAGGPSESEAGWVIFNDSVPYISSYALADGKRRITVPYGVVSESYDSTVKQTEKGFIENLRDAAAGIAGRYEHGSDAVDWKKSHPIRFMHLFRRRRGGVVQGVEPQPEWLVKNMPIGDVFGPGTYTLVDHSAITWGTGDSVELRFRYTDKPVTDAPAFDGEFRWYDVNETSGPALGGALTDTSEPAFAPGVDAPMPIPNGAAYAVTTNHQPTDVDVTAVDISDLAYEGASSVWGATAMMQRIDRARTEVTLSSDVRSRLFGLVQFDAQAHGVRREKFMKGLLAAIDDERAPIRGRFQCVRMKTGDVASPRPFGHVMLNESDATGGVTWQWLVAQLQKGPVLIEVGNYEATERAGGFWALATGVVEHNNLRRVLCAVDIDESAAGGLRNLVGTVGTVAGVPYVAEWSTSAVRTHIETAISLEYDPSLVFTSVDEDIVQDAFDLRVAPQPSAESVTITWDQAQTSFADVALLDLTGREAARSTLQSDSRRFTWTVDVRTLATGQYRAVIRTPRSVVGVSVVVVR